MWLKCNVGGAYLWGRSLPVGVEHTCGGRACCCRDDSGINSVEASCRPESLAALKACLDRVKGVENYVHCGPCYTTCLCVCGGGEGITCDIYVCICMCVACACVMCTCDVCMHACDVCM